MNLFETLGNALIPENSKIDLLNKAIEFFVNTDNTIVAISFKPDCNLVLYFDSDLYMQQEWKDYDYRDCFDYWHDDKSYLKKYMIDNINKVKIVLG